MSDSSNTPDMPDTPDTPQKAAGSSNRRGFMFKIGAGLMGVGGLLISAPILGYILAPSVIDWKKRRSWIDLGPLEDFPVGKTQLAVYKNPIHGPTVGLADQIPCWVRRTSESDFQIFYINCAHLGCPVHWFEESKLFMCPCHGGVYYEDGSRASGPPPRGLFEYDWQVVRGKLYVYGGEMPNLQIPGKLPESEVTPLMIEGKEYLDGKVVAS